MVVTDLDGTIIKRRMTAPSAYTIQTLHDLKEKGVILAIASGRAIGIISKETLDAGFDYALCANGTCIYDLKNDDLLSEQHFPLATIRELYDFAKERGDLYTLVAKKPMFDNAELEKIVAFFGGIRNDFHEIHDNLWDYLVENKVDIHKFEIFLRPDKVKKTMEIYKQTFNDLVVTTAGLSNIEILPKGTGKDKALLALCEKLGIDSSETIVMGDSENDLEMLKVGGYRIVPSNGKKALKEMADYVALPCDQDGPAKALREIFELDKGDTMDISIKERCHLLTGKGNWHTDDLNGKIANIKMCDGPHGLRAQEDGQEVNDSIRATCFPTACAIANSFDEDMAFLEGQRIAMECLKEGVGLLLGPGVCIKRSPLCGRNFEYYSEDPLLAGKMGAAFIKGVQSMGVGACVKHFAGNNQETHRMISNSLIDERALREIYLRAFEIAIKEADPSAVMASYNLLNGKHATANSYLLKDILKKEWKYEGAVISDWCACADLKECVENGLDLEMPDSFGNHYYLLVKAIRKAEIKKEDIIEASDRVSKLVKKHQACNNRRDFPDLLGKNHEIARQMAADSAVLLKNDGYLPLHNERVLIVGDLAKNVRYQGNGSSHINTDEIDDIFVELKKCGYDAEYAKGYDVTKTDICFDLENEAIARVQKFDGKILFFGGLTDKVEGEGYDRNGYELPFNQLSLLGKILGIRKDVAFIAFSGSPFALGEAIDCKAILHMYLGGESVMGGLCDLLVGKTSPSGRLAESYPYSIEDTPCYENFGLQNKSVDDVHYLESIFVGYRYYDTFNIKTAFGFGDGLSYASFEYSDLKIEGRIVSFNLRNTSRMKAKEVCEVYVQNSKTPFLRAKRELRGFKKVELLPNEERRIFIELDERSFMVYADKTMAAEKGYVTIGGNYLIEVGPTMKDIRLSESIEVAGEDVACLKVVERIPMTIDDFADIYEYELTDITSGNAGDFSFWNSLSQLSKYSKKARDLSRIIRAYLAKGKEEDDPVTIMNINTVLEGPLDCITNRLGKAGLLLGKALLADANKRK